MLSASALRTCFSAPRQAYFQSAAATSPLKGGLCSFPYFLVGKKDAPSNLVDIGAAQRLGAFGGKVESDASVV